MPTYPLPPDAPIGGSDLVCTVDGDVEEILPHFVNESDSAPVRDAIKVAIVEMLLEYQRQSTQFALNHDEAFAEEVYLDGLGSDQDQFRQNDEVDADYRVRLLVAQLVVSPEAICVAVNSILEPHTAVRCKYFEQLDAWFVNNDVSAAWSCHIYDGDANTTPHYPDRLYPDDAAANGGYECEHRGPGGAVVFSDHYGRHFCLRVPSLEFLDAAVAAVFTYASDADVYASNNPEGFFVSDGTSASNSTFVHDTADTESDVYQSIVNAVDRLKGHGIRWTMFADSQLQ